MDASRREARPFAARKMHKLDAKEHLALAQQSPARAIGYSAMSHRMREGARARDRVEQRNEILGKRRRRQGPERPGQARSQFHYADFCIF